MLPLNGRPREFEASAARTSYKKRTSLSKYGHARQDSSRNDEFSFIFLTAFNLLDLTPVRREAEQPDFNRKRRYAESSARAYTYNRDD